MYIDRIFSVSGFGTVVTGSILGGKIGVGDHAFLLPQGKDLKIRRIERHGKDTDSVRSGDRASLNVTGLSRDEFVRGMVIAGRALKPTNLIDARLRLFENRKPIGLWSQGIFIMGTFEAQVRIHLLDCNRLESTQDGIVQIHLPQECIAQPGDKFILRSSSSDISIGGGEVIDPSPLHHRRRSPELIQTLQRVVRGMLPELIALEIRKKTHGISAYALSGALNISETELIENDLNLPTEVTIIKHGEHRLYIDRSYFETLKKSILSTLHKYHQRNPLQKEGRTVEELLGILEFDRSTDGKAALELVLLELKEKKVVKNVGYTWALAQHDVTVSEQLAKSIEQVEQYFYHFGLKVPLEAEIVKFADSLGIESKTFKQIMRHLQSVGTLYSIDGSYLHKLIVDEARIKLLTKLATTQKGITVAEFRDLIGANRKLCLVLLALFDNEKVVMREGDLRVITVDGKKMLQRF